MERHDDLPNAESVRELVIDGYLPFAEIQRAISWPNSPELRNENDAEHSFSLSLVAPAIAQQLGLDPGLTCQFATVHDFPEVFAGDVSVWDDEGRINKHKREAEAIQQIEQKWEHFPWLAATIQAYERQESEEARLVFALDKFIAILMIVHGDGYFWKSNHITHQDHLRKVEEVRPRIASHSLVLSWYDELLTEIEARQNELFYIDQ